MLSTIVNCDVLKLASVTFSKMLFLFIISSLFLLHPVQENSVTMPHETPRANPHEYGLIITIAVHVIQQQGRAMIEAAAFKTRNGTAVCQTSGVSCGKVKVPVKGTVFCICLA